MIGEWINLGARSDVCCVVRAGAWGPRASVGDVEFEDLYRRELRTMIALATSLTGNREVGVDLAHEAMLRAYRDWAKVGARDRPGAWVRRVVINLAIDHARRRQRERRALARLQPAPPMEPGDPESARFWAAVRALPERQRAAVALHYLDDLSVDEIAEILDVTGGTVKTSLFKARQSLARTLRAEEVG
jgi:RNA polymerase sigma-70 factor (ECF subfamily)